jgi:hypothetical protein
MSANVPAKGVPHGGYDVPFGVLPGPFFMIVDTIRLGRVGED